MLLIEWHVMVKARHLAHLYTVVMMSVSQWASLYLETLEKSSHQCSLNRKQHWYSEGSPQLRVH